MPGRLTVFLLLLLETCAEDHKVEDNMEGGGEPTEIEIIRHPTEEGLYQEGMVYYQFLERFGPRIRHSPKQWESERKVFLALDEDLDGLISDREIQNFPCALILLLFSRDVCSCLILCPSYL